MFALKRETTVACLVLITTRMCFSFTWRDSVCFVTGGKKSAVYLTSICASHFLSFSSSLFLLDLAQLKCCPVTKQQMQGIHIQT